MDVRRLPTEHCRVVLLAHRDDDVQRFVAEAVEQHLEHAEVLVVHGAQRDVDDRQGAQRIEPRGMSFRWPVLDRTDALHRTCHSPGWLKAGAARVEMQAAVETTQG